MPVLLGLMRQLNKATFNQPGFVLLSTPHYISSMMCQALWGKYLVFIHNKTLCFPHSSRLGTISLLQHALNNHLINAGYYDHCSFFLSMLYEAVLYIHLSLLQSWGIFQGRHSLVLEISLLGCAWHSVSTC